MAKAPAAAAKIETVTLKHMAATLAESHEIPKKQSIALLEDLITQISKHLKKGARIRIGGLGVLQVRKRPARMGRNPATGEAIKIKASKKIAFRAAKELERVGLTIGSCDELFKGRLSRRPFLFDAGDSATRSRPPALRRS